MQHVSDPQTPWSLIYAYYDDYNDYDDQNHDAINDDFYLIVNFVFFYVKYCINQ